MGSRALALLAALALVSAAAAELQEPDWQARLQGSHERFTAMGATKGRGLLQTMTASRSIPTTTRTYNNGYAQKPTVTTAKAPGTVQAASASSRPSVPKPTVPRPMAGAPAIPRPPIAPGTPVRTKPVVPPRALPTQAAAGAPPPAAPKPATLADFIAAAAEAFRNMPAAPAVPSAPAPPHAPQRINISRPHLQDNRMQQIRSAIPGCSLAQQLLKQCKYPPPPPSPPPRPPTPPPPPPGSTYMEREIKNGTCKATLLNNGNFEKDKKLDTTKLIGWAKFKENATVGGGGLYNGNAVSYTGRAGYPFDNPNRYFRTRQAGNIAFALVNNAPFNVTSKDQSLYFDWFVDNPWPYWFIGQSMSINANGTDVIVHQARVDLYDYDKLSPPGNFTELAQMLFDQFDYAAGDAYLGPALPAEVLAATPNLRSMATEVPLAPYVGKRVLVAFRLTTNVYYLAWGIDNVQIIECKHEKRE